MTNTDRNEEIDLIDEVFASVIPKFHEAHDIMVSLLDFPQTQKVRIADLGSGFGAFSNRIFNVLPSATLFAVDRSKDILERTRKRLPNDVTDQYIPFLRDLNDKAWMHELDSLDAVLSSFTLDFLTLDRHEELIHEAYHLLNPQGRWISCEFFRTEDNRINRVFHEIEIRYVQNEIKAGNVDKDQIDRMAKSNLLRQQHHVCTVGEKMAWMKKAGYRQIEIPWKFLNLAVISGIK